MRAPADRRFQAKDQRVFPVTPQVAARGSIELPPGADWSTSATAATVRHEQRTSGLLQEASVLAALSTEHFGQRPTHE